MGFEPVFSRCFCGAWGSIGKDLWGSGTKLPTFDTPWGAIKVDWVVKRNTSCFFEAVDGWWWVFGMWDVSTKLGFLTERLLFLVFACYWKEISQILCKPWLVSSCDSSNFEMDHAAGILHDRINFLPWREVWIVSACEKILKQLDVFLN